MVLDEMPEQPLCIARKKNITENTSKAVRGGTHPPRIHTLYFCKPNIHEGIKELRKANLKREHKISYHSFIILYSEYNWETINIDLWR